MTPVPFDLPLHTGEAAALASLVLEHAEGKPLNDNLRNRLASRAAVSKMTSIRPYFASLEKDPIHPSTFYLAVDGLDAQPLLLHIAPATAPSSALFPKAILIGRMQAAGGGVRREIVVNASWFAATDSDRIRTFAEEVNRAFLPRPQGSRPAISVGGLDDRLPDVFESFRSIFKLKGENVASIRISNAPETAAMWAAIRSGWREGYTLENDGIEISGSTGDEIARSLGAAQQKIRNCAACTRFGVNTPGLSSDVRFRLNAEIYDFVREIKIRQKNIRSFDFDFRSYHPEEIEPAVKRWKADGRPAQLVSIDKESLPRITELAAMAREFRTLLSFDAGSGKDLEMLKRVREATNGRVDCKITVSDPGEIPEVFRNLFG